MQCPIGRIAPASPVRQPARAWGFTLVELAVTLAVAAILVAIATPSFTSIMNSNRLSSAANEMVAMLQVGRMEAVRRNSTVNVCVDCDGTGSLIVYVDADDDASFDSGEEIVRQSVVDPAVEITAGANVAFRPDGLGRDSDDNLASIDYRFCIPTTKPADNIRVVSIGSGSRISTEPDTGSGSCP